MRIDNDIVNVGDRPWHDRYGVGTVTKVVAGTCDVQFDSSSNAITFTEGGYKGGHKCLWWSNPWLGHVPRKGINYDGLVEHVQALINFKYGAQ